jgi:hypothetical protein
MTEVNPWDQIFRVADPEAEYQHLLKVAPLPAESPGGLLYRLFALQCEYSDEGWLVEVVQSVANALRVTAETQIFESLDKVHVKGKLVTFSPLAKKVVLNIVTAWCALAYFPYGNPAPDFDDRAISNTTWFCGVSERMMIAQSIQFRVLVELLRRSHAPPEETDTGLPNRIRNPGRPEGDAEAE